MFQCRSLALKLSLVMVILLTRPSTGTAQTTAVGPYYATPSWDQLLPVSTRFIVLANLNSEAVLDRETGLVWERTPDLTLRIRFQANEFCLERRTGGRMGWRLPKAEELFSLIDPALIPTAFFEPQPAALPAGHPFNLGYPASPTFMSSSALGPPFGPTDGGLLGVSLTFGILQSSSPGDVDWRTWCVRAPGGDGPF